MSVISTAIQELRASCDECIDNSQRVQIPEAISTGDMFPQGDIGLLVVTGIGQNWKEMPWPEFGDMQLAPGVSRGSRHTIPRKYMPHVRLFRIADGDRLSDIGIMNDAPFNLEHPEHADHIGYPPGAYRVCHQQNAAMERVRD